MAATSQPGVSFLSMFCSAATPIPVAFDLAPHQREGSDWGEAREWVCRSPSELLLGLHEVSGMLVLKGC